MSAVAHSRTQRAHPYESVLTLTFLRTLRRARVAKAVAVLSSLPRAMYIPKVAPATMMGQLVRMRKLTAKMGGEDVNGLFIGCL